MKYPDLTGKLMIHSKLGGRLRVWKRISKYYYAVHFVYGDDTPRFTVGIAGVGHLYRSYYEVIPNPDVIPWHALCIKYPEFDDSRP